MKHEFDDIRNVIERSSARETTMRVALGSICRKLLEEFDIHVASYVTQIHNIQDSEESHSYDVNKINAQADLSPIRVLNKNVENEMINSIKKADHQRTGNNSCISVTYTHLTMQTKA